MATNRREYARAYYAKNKDRINGYPYRASAARRHALKKLGATEQDYAQAYAAQGGRCAICGTDDPSSRRADRHHFDFDHDHTTGALRGLLCSGCNTMLGKARDSVAVLEDGAAYLKLWTTKSRVSMA